MPIEPEDFAAVTTSLHDAPDHAYGARKIGSFPRHLAEETAIRQKTSVPWPYLPDARVSR
jgi:hypothetical protein